MYHISSDTRQIIPTRISCMVGSLNFIKTNILISFLLDGILVSPALTNLKKTSCKVSVALNSNRIQHIQCFWINSSEPNASSAISLKMICLYLLTSVNQNLTDL